MKIKDVKTPSEWHKIYSPDNLYGVELAMHRIKIIKSFISSDMRRINLLFPNDLDLMTKKEWLKALDKELIEAISYKLGLLP